MQFIKSDDALVLSVHDRLIMHHVFGEELGELEKAMGRAFHGYFKKDIRVDNEVGVMLPENPLIALEAAHRASPTNGTHLSLPNGRYIHILQS